ncbi:DNA glycosylase [Mycena belliarum]|uniref:DNA glycosylase n=1 Tax=Mycena belliarum TaxID=1033014 RepID=A0AAD6UHJ7_9AGAR|nr:DNA glycosylase [Mycena belliae]
MTPQTPRTPRRRLGVVQSPYFAPKRLKSTEELSSQDIHRLRERLIELKPSLIQEAVADDPWKLLVAAILLNKTAGKLAIPVFWAIMSTYPNAWTLSQASEIDLVDLIRPLGTQNVRAKRLINLSRAYLQDPPSQRDERLSRAMGLLISPRKREKYPRTPISHLPGAGPYALDSYRIFCSGPESEEWKEVNPNDKELVRYLKWKWAVTENKQWVPGSGVGRSADSSYMQSLVAELEMHSGIRKTADLGMYTRNGLKIVTSSVFAHYSFARGRGCQSTRSI